MSNYMMGIDVSHHNNKALIESILCDKTANVDFVIAKATESVAYKDVEFDFYMRLALSYNKLIGAYHYVNSFDLTAGSVGSDLTAESARNEAYNFCSYVRPYSSAILVLDFEEKHLLNQQGVDYLYLVAKEVKNMTGTPPLIYMSESTYKQFDFSELIKLGCGLWSAKWGKNRAVDLTEVGQVYNKAESGRFGVVAIQQISSKGFWKNQEIPLDVDLAFMSKDAWRCYANPRLRK